MAAPSLMEITDVKALLRPGIPFSPKDKHIMKLFIDSKRGERLIIGEVMKDLREIKAQMEQEEEANQEKENLRGWQLGIYGHWSSYRDQVHKLAGQDYIGCNSIEEAELLLRKKGINNYYDEFNQTLKETTVPLIPTVSTTTGETCVRTEHNNLSVLLRNMALIIIGLLVVLRDRCSYYSNGVFKRTIPSIDEAMTDVPYGLESKLGNGIGGLFTMLEAKVIIVSLLFSVFMM
ncbi:hypothetical protein IFM89_024779 [Coptis chinensis]|uniref:Uncharacterized protein n=1 Tax=Coptis chinensis TaxID=261450 RepID=A0A835HPL1_9MAGN|nr:hypothetical protein IFM89_024779 [Coptis chinensis]